MSAQLSNVSSSIKNSALLLVNELSDKCFIILTTSLQNHRITGYVSTLFFHLYDDLISCSAVSLV